MAYRYGLVTFLLLYSTLSFAQTIGKADTLTTKERAAMKLAARNTAQGYYQLADSFAHKGDSINAGAALLKIDPYYFFFQELTPDSLNTLLASRFKLTALALEQYKELYTRAYNGPKSESYTNFKAMYKEDIATKHFAENCGDSFTCASAAKRIRTTDSTHSVYLYNYIQKNGWPSLSNGAQYAGILALHDHLRYHYYLPILRKAALNGIAAPEILELMIRSGIADNVYTSTNKYSGFHELLNTHPYRVFDISSVLNNRMPSSIARIEKAVAKLCPARLSYFYEASDEKMYTDWNEIQTKLWMHGGDTDDNSGMGGGMLPKVTRDLYRYMCKTSDSLAYKYGLTNTHYHPSENTAPKLILYVIQDKDIP